MKLNPFFVLGLFRGFILLAGFWETGCQESAVQILGVLARGSTGRRFRSCKGAPQDPQLSSWLSFPRKSAAFVPQQQVAIFCATRLSYSLVDLRKYLGNPHKVLNFFDLNFLQMLHFLKPSPTNVKKLHSSAGEHRVHLIIGYTAFFLPAVL